jgi:uncharacterized glyoxalase superfamily protein PhnB
MNTTEKKMIQRIFPVVRYRDARGGIEWLNKALGFTEHVVYDNDDGTIAHAELALAGNLIMLGAVKENAFGTSGKEPSGVTASSIYIALENAGAVDAVYARAKSAGAEITRELTDMDYGSHEFSVRDPDGHLWSFGTYRPEV